MAKYFHTSFQSYSSTFSYSYFHLRILGEEKGEHLISDKKYRHLLAPAITLATITVLYGVGAEYLVPFMGDATNVLLDPSLYIDAVFEGVK